MTFLHLLGGKKKLTEILPCHCKLGCRERDTKEVFLAFQKFVNHCGCEDYDYNAERYVKSMANLEYSGNI